MLGRGNSASIILRAVFGTDVSIVCDSVRMVSLSMKGARISGGTRAAKGAMLFRRLSNRQHNQPKRQAISFEVVIILVSPFQSFILYLAMLVLQCFQKPVDESGACGGILSKRVWAGGRYIPMKVI